MDNQKRRVIIVFSPDSGDVATLAEKLGKKCIEADCAVVVKTAESVTIPEINAADILVFGAEEDENSLLTGGFQEIRRAFTGINLAGKIGAFFSYSMSEAINGLKKMVQDTNLSLVGSDLIFVQNGKSLKEKNIDKWIKQTCTTKA